MENKPFRGGHRGHRGYNTTARFRGGRFAHQSRFESRHKSNNAAYYDEAKYQDDGLVYPKKNSRAANHKTKLCRLYEKNEECKYGDKWFKAHGKDELRSYSDPVAKEVIKMYEDYEQKQKTKKNNKCKDSSKTQTWYEYNGQTQATKKCTPYQKSVHNRIKNYDYKTIQK